LSLLGFNANTIFVDIRTGKFTLDGARLMQAVVDLLNGERPVKLKSYTVATVPSAVKNPASLIYVSNETGGATLAFSDGTSWRRTADRAVIS
jgi:hypothetical protein